ncbi:Uncharacterized protein QTN25_001907 [Entamoeba marina]
MFNIFEPSKLKQSYESLLMVNDAPVRPEYVPPNLSCLITIVCLDGVLIVEEKIVKQMGGLLSNVINQNTNTSRCGDENEISDNNSKESTTIKKQSNHISSQSENETIGGIGKKLYVPRPRRIVEILLRPYYIRSDSYPLYISSDLSEDDVDLLLYTTFELNIKTCNIVHELVTWMEKHRNYTIPPDLELYVVNLLDPTISNDVFSLSFLYGRLQSKQLQRFTLEYYLMVNGVNALNSSLKEPVGSICSYIVSKIIDNQSLFPSVLYELINTTLTVNACKDILLCCLYLLQVENKRKSFVLRGTLALLSTKVETLKSDGEIVFLFLKIFSVCSQEAETQNHLWVKKLYHFAIDLCSEHPTDQNHLLCVSALGSYCGTIENNKVIIRENMHKFIINNFFSKSKEYRESLSLVATETFMKLSSTTHFSGQEKDSILEQLLDFLDESPYMQPIINVLQIIRNIVGDHSSAFFLSKRWFSLTRLITRFIEETEVVTNTFKIAPFRFELKNFVTTAEEVDVYVGACLRHIDNLSVVSAALQKNGMVILVNEIICKYESDEIIEACAGKILWDMAQKCFGIMEMYTLQLPQQLCEIIKKYNKNSLILSQFGSVLAVLGRNVQPKTNEIFKWTSVCYMGALSFVHNPVVQQNSLALMTSFLEVTEDYGYFEQESWIDIVDVVIKEYSSDMNIQYYGLKLFSLLLKRQKFFSKNDMMDYLYNTLTTCSGDIKIISLIVDCTIQLLSPLESTWKNNLKYFKEKAFLDALDNVSQTNQTTPTNINIFLKRCMLSMIDKNVTCTSNNNRTKSGNTEGLDELPSVLHFCLYECINTVLESDLVINASLENKSIDNFIEQICKYDFDNDIISSVINTLTILSPLPLFTNFAWTSVKMVGSFLFKCAETHMQKVCALFFALLPDNIYELDNVSNFIEAITSTVLSILQNADKTPDLAFLCFLCLNNFVVNPLCRELIQQFNIMGTLNDIIVALERTSTEEIVEPGKLLLNSIK